MCVHHVKLLPSINNRMDVEDDMLKDLVKVANRLDELGYNKEADAIDLLIRKMASEDDFEMNLFKKAREIPYSELDTWINNLELKYRYEEMPYDHFDIDTEEEEWTVFYDPMNDEDCVKVKCYESAARSNKRWSIIQKDFEYVCSKVKENFIGNDIIGGFEDNCNLMFKVEDKTYSMQPGYGGNHDLELVVLDRKIWGQLSDFEFDPEYMTSQEFAGVEWIMWASNNE